MEHFLVNVSVFLLQELWQTKCLEVIQDILNMLVRTLGHRLWLELLEHRLLPELNLQFTKLLDA